MKKLGIIGGMGPLATADFFKKIIDHTDANGDAQHIPIIIENNPQIPDRTAHILDKSKPSPLNEIVKSGKILINGKAEFIAIPCNTSHLFYKDIQSHLSIPVINMIDETAHYVSNHYSDTSQVMLLATIGTYTTHIYKEAFAQKGIEVLYPNDQIKDIVYQLIYQVKSNPNNIDVKLYEQLMDYLSEFKDMPIILGCTELPILMSLMKCPYNVVDTTLVLALKCIELCKN